MWYYHKDKGLDSTLEAKTLDLLIKKVVKYNTRNGDNEYEGFDRIVFQREDGTVEKLPLMIDEFLDEHFISAAAEDAEEAEFEEEHNGYRRSLMGDRI